MDIQWIESLIVVFVFLILKFGIAKGIDKTIERRFLQKSRGKVVKKGVNVILILIALSFLFFIWGVQQSELAIFLSSFLAVLGVALFAQWSILSNITSGLIIFFSHPVKLEDTVCILDKDYHVEGKVSDIGLFFVLIKTKEGDKITIPSNVFVQKMVKHIPSS